MATVGDELPDLMTLKEVAEFLRVSPLTIRRWGKKGKLPPIRINSRGDRRYTKEAVLRLIGQMPNHYKTLQEDPLDESSLPLPPKPKN